MNAPSLIESLARTPETLKALVADLDPKAALWKPDSESWSILEVVCHLVDEEIDDFRIRLQMTLNDPSEPWPPIDPPAKALQRKYHELELRAEFESFEAERKKSIDWLHTLPVEIDWSLSYQHPQIGPISAGQLLASWAAHDQLHFRQIVKRQYQWICYCAGDSSTSYAGEWKA